ncbi:MAG: hypothetical protein H6988_03070 [Pseudomonadales bacterium]|nr:hypothetical protein [Pseudomonadales bacterium]
MDSLIAFVSTIVTNPIAQFLGLLASIISVVLALRATSKVGKLEEKIIQSGSGNTNQSHNDTGGGDVISARAVRK